MNITELDEKHVWHPYNALPPKNSNIVVKRTKDTHLVLEDGRELIDLMSSWWSVIHGYNHPKIVEAITQQANEMSHVMFGGLTHEPAVRLCEKLSKLVGLNSVFLCDSGSVSVEVALKTAMQYQEAKGKKRYEFIALEHGYHGDTLAAMSVCDPINSMHSIYGSYLPKHIFAPAPRLGLDANVDEDIKAFEEVVKANHTKAAGIILEPVVQGAGGMRIYNPKFLKAVRTICDQYELLLIADEIATGFGHTGEMFACELAGIKPDIMTIGKGLTAGTMSMAAMLTSKEISDTISNSSLGALMHGPTFMGNPLACSVALASLEILEEGTWKTQVQRIEEIFFEELQAAKEIDLVADIRNIGAIGVIELKSNEHAQAIQEYCVKHGVWIRPFGKLIYSIVSYTIDEGNLRKAIRVMIDAIKSVESHA